MCSSDLVIRKTAPTWKPKIRNSFINAIFQNGELSATPEETFSFDDYFDFYCINEAIFIKSKRAYESTTSDKKSYQRNFDSLLIDPSFIDIFVDIEPLKNYVGRGHDHPHVPLGAHLQVALDAGRGVVRSLALLAVRQEHDQAGALAPLLPGGGDVLVNHALGAVGEVAELRSQTVSPSGRSTA